MSDVHLHMDEDAGENAVVQGLPARGVDVLTTIEANRCGATDREQLAFATEQRRSIYTFNVGDFARLHREHLTRGIDHSGILVLPDQRCSVGEKIRRVAGFVSRVTAEEMADPDEAGPPRRPDRSPTRRPVVLGEVNSSPVADEGFKARRSMVLHAESLCDLAGTHVGPYNERHENNT